LSGGISDDQEWQTYLSHLIVYPSQQYDLPKGAISKRFLGGLATLLDMAVTRKCKLEQFLVYQLVILQQSPTVKSTSDIHHHLQWHMDVWEARKHAMLVQSTEQDMDYFLTTHQHGTTSAQRHQTFHRKVLRGEVRAAVRYLMATEKGGVLFPEDVDPITGQTVAEVLASKHPPPQSPAPTSLPSYPSTPDFIDLDITPDTIERVAHWLHGAAGVGGADAHALSYWLTGFGLTQQDTTCYCYMLCLLAGQ